jgi:hypothetical protein
MCKVKQNLKNPYPRSKLRGITGFHPLGQILLDNLAPSCGEMPSFDYNIDFYQNLAMR